MKLLLVEKDPLVKQWLKLQADQHGIQLLFAKDSSEALAAQNDPTLNGIVLEVSSCTDGAVPLWNVLRANPFLPHPLPILLYASSRRWQGVAEEESVAVDGVVRRPFTMTTIVRAIQEAIQRRQGTSRGDLTAATQVWRTAMLHRPDCA